MFLMIRNLLDEQRLKTVRDRLSKLEFVDGKARDDGAADQLRDALRSSQPFLIAAQPKIFPDAVFARHDQGESDPPRLDHPIVAGNPMIRADVSVSIWLNEPDHYGGGELLIETETGPMKFKGNAGDCVLYPADAVYRVNTVSSGSRLVANTVVQSIVRCHEQRRTLFELTSLANQLAVEKSSEAEVTMKILIA